MKKVKSISKTAKASEDLRRRIGSELHDNVIQLLLISKLFLSHSLVKQGDGKQLLEKSIEYLETAMSELRQLSHDLLGYTERKSFRLIESIEKTITSINDATGIKIVFNCSCGEDEIDRNKKIDIYRIIQEQLSNILKHADATEVSIEISKDNARAVLRITDNGRGFDTKNTRKGVGLLNIKQRVKRHKGKFRIISSVLKGVRIKVTI